jgi:hypothetical protein
LFDILSVQRSTREGKNVPTMLQDTTTQEDPTAENLLERLSDLENNPEESLVPYEEFEMGGETYYFTPGGFLYRKDPWSEEVYGFFCGFLSDEVWHYRTDNRW